MNRKQRVYDYFLSHEKEPGFTTQEIAKALSLQRTNVSKDLNELVAAGKIEKSQTRPVIYQLKTQFPDTNKNHVRSYKENRQANFLNPLIQQDIFVKIIGEKGSMKSAIEEAKAAILYPPKGLHTLITGATGSGKTYFAHAMFEFAKQQGLIAKEKNMVVFNCADYAHNPQLLMSHLFGYTKGAFTGATEEKKGLMDEADGSILFLDEIHRLPPEGQEIIFYFMDQGYFNRLGESGKNHQANIRIIGATTEDPTSALLATFLRRIPLLIQLPAFSERPKKEQVEFVHILIAQEAKRIQRKIVVSKEVVKALIASVSYGNIGQLKSNIQLVCARGFLNHMQDETIYLTSEELPENLKTNLYKLTEKRENLKVLSQILPPYLEIDPQDSLIAIQEDDYEFPYNLYEIIGDKAALLKSEGLDKEEIYQFISTDINLHWKSFYQNHGFTFNLDQGKNLLLDEFVQPKVASLVEELANCLRHKNNFHFQESFVYALSFHLEALLKKLATGQTRPLSDTIYQMALENKEELELAKEFLPFIGMRLGLELPQNEVYYLTALLVSLKEHSEKEKVGIVVAAHGNQTATSMVEVAKELLKVTDVEAVDMPLTMSSKQALEKIKEAIKKVHQKAGVLLLVDMGSLTTFDEELKQSLNIQVRTIDLVSTATVLEASRRASVVGTTLEELYEGIKNYRLAPQKSGFDFPTKPKPKGIVAVCSSGEGTAKAVQQMIETSLEKEQRQDVKVLALSFSEVEKSWSKIEEKYDVIAVTGMYNPKIHQRYFPLEEFLQMDRRHFLRRVLGENKENLGFEKEMPQETALKLLEESLTYANPRKIVPFLKEYTKDMLNLFELKADFTLEVQLIVHLGHLVERLYVKEPLLLTLEEKKSFLEEKDYSLFHQHLKEWFQKLDMEIPVEEEYYLYQIIQNYK